MSPKKLLPPLKILVPSYKKNPNPPENVPKKIAKSFFITLSLKRKFARVLKDR